MMVKLVLPTSIPMGEYKRDTAKNRIGDKKKPFAINMNVFRNASSFLIKAADTNFRAYVKESYPELLKLKFKEVELQYTIYFGNKRRRDLMNVGAVVDKFLCDALQELGVIDDDNYEVISKVVFIAEKDIGNERIEVEIKERNGNN